MKLFFKWKKKDLQANFYVSILPSFESSKTIEWLVHWEQSKRHSPKTTVRFLFQKWAPYLSFRLVFEQKEQKKSQSVQQIEISSWIFLGLFPKSWKSWICNNESVGWKGCIWHQFFKTSESLAYWEQSKRHSPKTAVRFLFQKWAPRLYK